MVGYIHCPRCDRNLPEADFSRNRAHANGRNTWCKKCVRRHRDETRERDPDFERRVKVKQLYGLGWDEYQNLLAAGCAICGGPGEHLDHDHSTGKNRAALCQCCNIMLGQAHDNPDILLAAADYLEEHSATNS